MAVYIDGLGFTKNNIQYFHLYADTTNELHEFAAMIGLKRHWFEISNKGLPHYDISSVQYYAAVNQGAIECDRYGALYHLAKMNWDGIMLARIQKWRRQTFGFEYEHSPHRHRHHKPPSQVRRQADG